MVKDSLTVARAEYWMGRMLYYDGRKQEALDSFKKAKNFVGSDTGIAPDGYVGSVFSVPDQSSICRYASGSRRVWSSPVRRARGSVPSETRAISSGMVRSFSMQ